jgi:hypothetical protein
MFLIHALVDIEYLIIEDGVLELLVQQLSPIMYIIIYITFIFYKILRYLINSRKYLYYVT